MRTDINLRFRTSGVTLLEMLTGLVIGMSLVMLAAKSYYILYREQLRQHVLQTQQYRAQRVFSILDDEIAIAGHIGCSRLSRQMHVLPFMSHSLTVDNALEVYRNILTVRYQSPRLIELVNSMRNRSYLVAESQVIFRRGQLLLISDCQHAEIFQVDRVVVNHGLQYINPVRALTYRYQHHAEIGEWIERQYFIRERGAHKLSSLIRVEGGRSVEMVEGVDHLIFKSDAKGLHYRFDTVDHNLHFQWRKYMSSLSGVEQ